MNTQRFIRAILFSLPVLLSGCAADDTTTGGKEISKITIDTSSIQTEYNQAKNDIVVIEPKISQSMAGKPLSYEWEINHKSYSAEPVLHYYCNELGTFEGRLIVANEDGKAFFPFKIHVNTPYEEGLVIISNDPDGKSMVSFMLHHTDDTPDTFAEGDVFSINNPEIPFASNVCEVIQSNGNLIIACKGSEQTGEPASIYYLQEKTLDIENYVTVPEYPGFKPIRMMVSMTAFGGASYPTLSEDGKVYEFASTEGAVVTSTKFPGTYDTESFVFFDDGNGGNYNIFLWDNELNIPVTMFNGYGGFYCIPDYSKSSERSAVNAQTNLFAAGNDTPVAMFIPRFTKVQLTRETPHVYIITCSQSGQLRRTAIEKGVWKWDNATSSNKFMIKETLGNIGQKDNVPFKAGVPMIASQTNKRLFYAMGNKIYQWFYTQNSLTQATVFAEVGNSSTIVTSLELSTDQKTLYAAAYNPGEPGLNGSCYIIGIEQNSSTEEVYAGEITAHERVAYQPVKIIYKQK